METPQKHIHLGWLDAIRGAAALYVVCHHAVMQVEIHGDHANDIFYRILQLLTLYGHYAVDVFIVLSGYCLMLPVIAKKEFGSLTIYYLRRTCRIVLPYFAALILSLLFIKYFIGVQDGSNWAITALPVTFINVVKHGLLIHQWWLQDASKINPAFWSVGVEYQIYFLFPVFYWLAKKIGFICSLICITIFSYSLWALCYYFNLFNPSSTGASLYYCALFCMGMTAAEFAKNLKHNNENSWLNAINRHAKLTAILALSGIFTIAVFSFLIARFLPSIFFPLQIQSFFIGLLFSILLYLNNKNKGVGKKLFIQDIFEWFGTIGFSIYLLHYPILAIVWKYIVKPMHINTYWMQTLVQLLLGILLTIIAAKIFYKFIELPCHQLSNSIIKRK